MMHTSKRIRFFCDTDTALGQAFCWWATGLDAAVKGTRQQQEGVLLAHSFLGLCRS